MRMTIVRQQARWPAGADRATISHFAWYKNIGQASRPNLNQQPSMQFGTGPV